MTIDPLGMSKSQVRRVAAQQSKPGRKPAIPWEVRESLVMGILDEPKPFNFIQTVTGYPKMTVRETLHRLRARGLVKVSGRARGALWLSAPAPAEITLPRLV